MARKIDPTLAKVLAEYDEGTDAVWDCHGTWVAYHAAVERIAARAGVVFEPPQIIEASAHAGVVAICVTGRMKDRTEWSFGEASPKNNKNAYPYAMAEKRAKDRVVLKLVGLHGIVFSEEEADDFKPTEKPPPANNTDLDEQTAVSDLIQRMNRVSSSVAFDALTNSAEFNDDYGKLSDAGKRRVKAVGRERREQLEPKSAAA